MNLPQDTELVENYTFDEISIGQSARLVRGLTLADIEAFAAVSGDTNPAHLDPEYANDTLFHGVIAHGMWSGALISALLGTQFPGPGTIYQDQALHFVKPVRVGDTLTVKSIQDTKEQFYNLRVVGISDNRQFSLQPSVFVPISTWDEIRPQAAIASFAAHDCAAPRPNRAAIARTISPNASSPLSTYMNVPARALVMTSA